MTTVIAECNCTLAPELPSVNTRHRVLIVQCYRLPARLKILVGFLLDSCGRACNVTNYVLFSAARLRLATTAQACWTSAMHKAVHCLCWQSCVILLAQLTLLIGDASRARSCTFPAIVAFAIDLGDMSFTLRSNGQHSESDCYLGLCQLAGTGSI